MTSFRNHGEVQVLSILKFYEHNLDNVNRALAEIITCKGKMSEAKWGGLSELIKAPWQIKYAFTIPMEESPRTYNVYHVFVDNLQEDTIKAAIIADIKRMDSESEAINPPHIRFNPWEGSHED